MNLWRLLILGYAGLYTVLALAIHADNVKAGYPAPFILCSAMAQACVTIGVIVFGFGREAVVAKLWKRLFPFLILELCIGITLDATVPRDYNPGTHGLAWMANLLFNLWLATPAYYFNFKIARYGG